MPFPKHLWSGDWQRESAAAAAAREHAPTPAAPTAPTPAAPAAPAQPDAPPARAPAPVEPPAREAPRPRVTPRPAAPPRPTSPSWLGRRVMLVTIVGALVLIGSVWALSGGASTNAASHGGGGAQPYLGMNLQSVPVDRVLVQSVVPGSPADQAGIGPGDLLLTVNGHAVSSPGEVYRILSGLQPGDAVTLQLQQGPVSITAQVQLAAGGP